MRTLRRNPAWSGPEPVVPVAVNLLPSSGWFGPLKLAVSCDMKLHSVLLGWSNPDQALRVAAGTPRKHASDGRGPRGPYCPGCEAFPVM